MSQFSTNESVSLEKCVEIKAHKDKTPAGRIKDVYELNKCAEWILENGYEKVCLQFPDYLMADSPQVVGQLEKLISNKVYVLGDTAYGSCCVDFVAASHVAADAIIHFGHVCFSRPEQTVPSLCIYEKSDLDVSVFVDAVRKFTGNNLVLLIDTPYLHKLDEIRNHLREVPVVCMIEDDLDLDGKTVIYLGQNDKKLLNICLSFASNLYHYDMKSDIKVYKTDNKLLQRRYFLVEKIKDSAVIGIVIATLAVKNYLAVIERMKTLAKVHDKKYYVISVGKPTVAKLANFPEIDVYVLIGCAMNEIYESRDYYKPIVTPHDLETALNSTANVRFSYDYNKLVGNEIDPDPIRESDVSLLTGKIRCKSDVVETGEAVAVRPDGSVQPSRSGAGYLAGKSWKGLEQKLGETDAQLAVKGRSGVAQGYENEK